MYYEVYMTPLQSRETWNNDSFAFDGITLQHIHQEKNVPSNTNEAIGHLYSVYECVNKIFDLIQSKSNPQKELKDYLFQDLKHMEFLIGIIKKTYTVEEMKEWDDFVSQKLKHYEAYGQVPETTYEQAVPLPLSISPPSPQQVTTQQPKVIHITGAVNRDTYYKIIHNDQGIFINYFHCHGQVKSAKSDKKSLGVYIAALQKCSNKAEELEARYPDAAEKLRLFHAPLRQQALKRLENVKDIERKAAIERSQPRA